MSALSFGTSGLRGLVSAFTEDACQFYCAAFAVHLGTLGPRPSSILIGRDLRASSPGIAASCMAAFGHLGIGTVDCGALPTPALALEAMSRGAPAVMVTGSHIPADRNGLKFYRADGEIDKNDEAGIRRALGSTTAFAHVAGATVADGAAFAAYRRRYASLRQAVPLDGLRVGIYQHSSVSRDILSDVLRALGADTVAFGRTDAFTPVDTEAVEPSVASAFAEFARDQAVSAIVSTDGDGDRPLIADEAGRILRGDAIGTLTAWFLGAAAVATPVTSSSAVEESGLFARVARTRVGSPYVIEAMAGMDRPGAAVVGFEANGGVLLGTDVALDGAALSRLPTRDALLPIVAVLALARREAANSVSGLMRLLPSKRTASGRIKNVPSEVSAAWLLSLQRADAAESLFAPAAAPVATSAIDGVKFVLASGGSIHFRASGNAPEMRCYAEANSQGEAEDLLAWGLAHVRRAML